MPAVFRAKQQVFQAIDARLSAAMCCCFSGLELSSNTQPFPADADALPQS